MQTLLLNSGGIDSRLAGFFLQKQGWDILSVFVDFGQLNTERARVSAKRTAEMLEAEHHEVTVSFPFDVAIERKPHYFIVPYVHPLVVTIGAIIARKRGIKYLLTGIKGDHWTPELDRAVHAMIGTGKLSIGMTILHPLGEINTYQESIELVDEPIELDDAVSCGQKTPCTKCLKCLARKEVGLNYG